MKLGDLVGPNDVTIGLRVGNKAQLLSELARIAATKVAVPGPALLTALSARERLGSTGLGRGFALPHARVAGVQRLFGMFARLARPLDYGAMDGQPIDLMFLLLIPPAAGSEHVAALAAIARAMRESNMLQNIRSAESAADLYRHLVGPEHS